MPSTKRRKRKGHYKNWAVGFFDILGQSDALESIREFTLKGGAISATALVTTMDRLRTEIDKHRAVFQGFVEGNAKGSRGRGKKARMKFAWFSDCVVMWHPTFHPKGGSAPRGLADMIYGAAMSSMMLPSEGAVMRGGLDVDMAEEFWKNEIYGPAFLGAYQLEKKADWPRVVLGRSAIAYLDSLPNDTDENKFGRIVREKLVTTDDFGVPFIDFAGEGFRNLIRGMGRFEEYKLLFQDALRYAREQMVKHVTNLKVQSKYERLNSYLESRAPHWT